MLDLGVDHVTLTEEFDFYLEPVATAELDLITIVHRVSSYTAVAGHNYLTALSRLG